MTLHKFKLITKPFWIPSITAFYLAAAPAADPLVIAALFFGYTGDILLMRQKKSWFTAGAFSFMIGHLFYTSVFFLRAGGFDVFLSKPVFCIIFVLPYISYIFILKRFLGKNVSSVFYAVAIYLSFLLLMSYMSLLCLWNVHRLSFLLSFSGSILFIISDTLVGMRKLKMKFRGIGTVVVITYLAAQILIISGLVF